MAHIEYKQDGYKFVIFTSSENWTAPAGVTKVDITLVGGGAAGSGGYIGGNSECRKAYGGKGGEGGEVKTKYDINVIGTITVVIGASQGNTSFGNITATGANLRTDVTSGYAWCNPFNEETYARDASNGLYGTHCPLTNTYYAGSGASAGATSVVNWYHTCRIDALGGSYYDGGGSQSSSGTANTGGGGGGGEGLNYSNDSINMDDQSRPGHLGGSGVIILRYKIEKSNNIFFANNF